MVTGENYCIPEHGAYLEAMMSARFDVPEDWERVHDLHAAWIAAMDAKGNHPSVMTVLL